MASGFRGGWSWTLTTVNLMNNPGPQGSLSEDLRYGAFIAHRQFVTPPRTPARQHRPSVLGFHSRPGTMRLGALSIIRLKCTFRHVIESKPGERSAYGVDF